MVEIKLSRPEADGERLDKFIYNQMLSNCSDWNNNKFSREKIKNIIFSGKVLKNNIVCTNVSYKVKCNDEFIIDVDTDEKLEIQPINMDIDIVYEDDELLVINKQANLTVHPLIDNYENINTLVNVLLYRYGRDGLSDLSGYFRPGIVHRLDKNTSGLMVVAKNNKIHLALQQQLKVRILSRVYKAFVWGIIIPNSGTIEGYIKRSDDNRLKMTMSDSGKYSLTSYNVLETYGDAASCVECKLDTGRTHQIRVHMSSIKHPLIGDKLYGGNRRKFKGDADSCKEFIEQFPRQALHSVSIDFIHPITNKNMHFDVDIPNDMKELEDNLHKLAF